VQPTREQSKNDLNCPIFARSAPLVRTFPEPRFGYSLDCAASVICFTTPLARSDIRQATSPEWLALNPPRCRGRSTGGLISFSLTLAIPLQFPARSESHWSPGCETLQRAFTVGWTTKGLQLKERAGKVRPTTRENWSCPTIPLYFLTGYYPLWTKVLPRGWQIFRRLYRSARRTIEKAIRLSTGGSFRLLREEILLVQAKALFASQPTLPIKELGFRLGFKSATSFARAVKRASGFSPEDLRIRVAREFLDAQAKGCTDGGLHLNWSRIGRGRKLAVAASS